MAAASRLCDVVSRYLVPYLEPNPVQLTTETEKDLLLSLTQVRRDVKLWTTECYNEEDEVKDGATVINHSCHHSFMQTCKGENRCLCNIISAMVSFLGTDSPFVRHAAGNLIVSMSCFLIKHENLWAKFLNVILFFLETAMPSIFCSVLPATVAAPVEETLMLRGPTYGDTDVDQHLQYASFFNLFNSRLLNLNLLMVAELFQTLRSILKLLKSNNDELEQVFRQYFVSSLVKMPWDLLLEFFCNSCRMSQKSSDQEGALDIKSSGTRLKNLFMGTILQLCCSVADAYVSEDDGIDPSKELVVYVQFADLVPKLLSCCFICHMGNKHQCASGYLRHKLLVIMSRLSCHSHWRNSYPESWLKLLGNFFGEIWHETILGYKEYTQNCLYGSPFIFSTSVGYKSYTQHLKRLAIFLMFKCSFALASNGGACTGFACTEQATSSSVSPVCRMHSYSRLLETFAWLQLCFPTDVIICQFESYSELCSCFPASFLQLYMEEDDMLFKMLIQLLDAPFSALQMVDFINGSIEASKDILFNYSSIFNPIHLFHLLLQLLHYDHSVFVDYLISKDTGIHCLEYLLRCLRVIYMSWPSFKQFSVFGIKNGYPYLVRRKVLMADGPIPFCSMAAEFQGTTPRKQIVKKNNVGDSDAFENAKKCLFNLKLSLEDLHRKSLFPYNPNPLLKSLGRFQELCKT
ncbi:hypothetical protein HPP92_017192 [Vanilla planifolia]|uniref:Protein Lines C-terminal domain-containing protein n=1 Tax=Vanilla planifolia TaxID=51239 RepID=A0A835QE06_VANPL|nr:hypothetical protein HPP92_017192 [Vanilla planifolia]